MRIVMSVIITLNRLTLLGVLTLLGASAEKRIKLMVLPISTLAKLFFQFYLFLLL